MATVPEPSVCRPADGADRTRRPAAAGAAAPWWRVPALLLVGATVLPGTAAQAASAGRPGAGGGRRRRPTPDQPGHLRAQLRRPRAGRGVAAAGGPVGRQPDHPLQLPEQHPQLRQRLVLPEPPRGPKRRRLRGQGPDGRREDRDDRADHRSGHQAGRPQRRAPVLVQLRRSTARNKTSTPGTPTAATGHARTAAPDRQRPGRHQRPANRPTSPATSSATSSTATATPRTAAWDLPA